MRLPFDGLESILPIPQDAPLEIPRVILNSKDEKYTCNISLNRADFFVNYKNQEDKNFDDTFSSIIKYLEDINLLLSLHFNAKSYRLAAVFETIEELSISSKKFLEDTIIKNKLAKNIYTTQVNFLMKDDLDQFKINKWVRITTLRKKDDDNNDRLIQIIYDINTIQEVDYEVNSENISKFMRLSYSSINSTKKKILNI